MISSRFTSSLFILGLPLFFLFAVPNEATSPTLLKPQFDFSDLFDYTSQSGISEAGFCQMCQVASNLARNKGCQKQLGKRSLSACYSETLYQRVCTPDVYDCSSMCGHGVFTMASAFCQIYSLSPSPTFNSWKICQNNGVCNSERLKLDTDTLFKISKSRISEESLRGFLIKYIPQITGVPSFAQQQSGSDFSLIEENQVQINFLNAVGNFLNGGGGNALNGGSGNVLNGGSGNVLNGDGGDNSASLVQSATICEGSTQILECPVGQRLTILSARYGRSAGGEVCPGTNDFNTRCPGRPVDDLKKVANSCNGKTTCSLSALNTLFGDPCSDTHKYLGINYICGNGNTDQGAIVCEETTTTFSCPTGKIIRMTSAHFGRTTDGSTCPGMNTHVDNCYGNPSSDLAILSNACDGKTSCLLYPTDTYFGGDPCAGTYKYLSVTYQCLFSHFFFAEEDSSPAV